MIDFHCHSTMSDGTLTPSELMKKAKESGLNYIALTDHDTINGLKEAREASKELGLNLINGVEISCQLKSGELHIVGLFIDPENKELNDFFAKLIKFRLDRNLRMIEKFKSIGINIDINELLDNNKKLENLGKPNFARYLYKKGYVKHEKESYNQYLNNGGLADVDKEKTSDIEAIQMIHNAGGIAILAHPDQVNLFNFKDFTNFIIDLKNKGLDGLEVYYSNYNKKQIKFYKKIAKTHGLLISGGSDYHGPQKYSHNNLGFYGVKKKIPTELLKDMKTYLSNRAR